MEISMFQAMFEPFYTHQIVKSSQKPWETHTVITQPNRGGN